MGGDSLRWGRGAHPASASDLGSQDAGQAHRLAGRLPDRGPAAPQLQRRPTRCEQLGVCQKLKLCKNCPRLRVDLTKPERHNSGEFTS